MRRELAQVFCALVEDERLIRVAELTGAHPSRVSRLRAGKLEEFSIPWLMRAIASFGYDFTVTVAPRPPAVRIAPAPTPIVVRLDRFGRRITV